MTGPSELAECVAIVTGCGQPEGIGAAVARALSEQGASVVVTDLRAASPDNLDELVRELSAAGRRSAAFRADISKEAECRSTVEFALATFGRLDILVNNAAADHGADRQPAQDVPLQQWQRVVEVNLTGAFLMSRAAVPSLKAQRQGRIVNISSIVAVRGMANRAAYASSKAGLLGLTLSLAAELAPWGVTVNAICPGAVATRRARSTARDRTGDATTGMDAQSRVIPLGRLGTAEDIAHAVAFLASPKAAYITGQHLVVDGGLGMSLPRVA